MYKMNTFLNNNLISFVFTPNRHNIKKIHEIYVLIFLIIISYIVSSSFHSLVTYYFKYSSSESIEDETGEAHEKYFESV
jgi:hypothetical protein